jgi:hypothetical protein
MPTVRQVLHPPGALEKVKGIRGRIGRQRADEEEVVSWKVP